MKTRSKNDFKNVFIKLLEDAPDKPVSVTDIIRNSDYSRSSFYRDYYDYDDFIKQLAMEEAAWLAKELFSLMKGFSTDHSLDSAVLERILSGVYSRKSFYHFMFSSFFSSSDISVSGFIILVMQEFKNLGSFEFNDRVPMIDEEFFRFSETIRFMRYIVFWDMKNYEYSIDFMISQIQSMNNISYDKGDISSFFMAE